MMTFISIFHLLERRGPQNILHRGPKRLRLPLDTSPTLVVFIKQTGAEVHVYRNRSLSLITKEELDIS